MRTMYAIIITVDEEIIYNQRSTHQKAGGAKMHAGRIIKNDEMINLHIEVGDHTCVYVIPVENPDQGWTRIKSRNGAGTLWWGSWYQQRKYDWLINKGVEL